MNIDSFLLQILKVPQPPPLTESQKQARAANEIVKNNQTSTYQIDDMCQAIEEIKVNESGEEVRT